jgi:hypothetical protein
MPGRQKMHTTLFTLYISYFCIHIKSPNKHKKIELLFSHYTICTNKTKPFKMQAQQQQQAQPKAAPRTCSCCGETGHTIKHCNSPRVTGFDEEAIATAKISASVMVLKNRRPFSNAQLPVLKAIASNLRIVNSVSRLTSDYLTHLLAYSYWNMHNDEGSHVNIRDSVRLNQLANECKQAAEQAVLEEIEAREARVREEQRQREQDAREASAQRRLESYMHSIAFYREQDARMEADRLQARNTFRAAGLVIPDVLNVPFTTGRSGAGATIQCLSCNSTAHTISGCKKYRGIPTMTKLMAIFYTKQEFRTKLQEYPNLYAHLAFAIQNKWVPGDCCDCVYAMNRISDNYYLGNASYAQIRLDLQQYKLEYAILQETGEALETNVIHDPRIKFYQSLLELSPRFGFHDIADETFLGKCIDLVGKIETNMFTPIDMTMSFKATSTATAAKDTQDDADAVNVVPTCAVCWGAWEKEYPIITFGCNHEMCSKCVNTYLKNPARQPCHMCREPIQHMFVPAEALDTDVFNLFEDIRVRILRQV